MRHPFDLEPQDYESQAEQNSGLSQDLEFEESLSSTEAERVGGGLTVTTLALGEEGGSPWYPCPKPQPLPPVKNPKPIDPPIYTTMALGEEGGFEPPEVTTYALGEEGGFDEVTSLAIGEEGGDASMM